MGDPLTDKVVLILGAAGGIGSACARMFADRGARVGLADVDGRSVSALADSLRVTAPTVLAREVDLTDLHQAVRAVEAVSDEFGRLDVVVNCVGVMYIRPLIETNVAEWETTVDLNLTSAMWVVAATLPVFLRQGHGHFVSIGSVHGLKVSPGSAVHSASKVAVNALHEGMRMELAGHGIRVTTVNPGAVDTGMQDKTTGTDRERLRAIYEDAMPADAVARAVAFAIEQPADVAVNEIVIRPTVQLI